MKTDRFVASSRQVYAALLKLYPRQHRAAYGADMLQLFTDQCKETGQARPGLASAPRRATLWLRTLFDLFVNAFKEHVTAPNASAGLIEAPPDTPLPWKGVFLVLLPGLAFFISQIGQLTGQDWFYWMVYRGAFIMIPPVILVWIWKRRFPVWGLIPLGLLYHRLVALGGVFSYYLHQGLMAAVRWNHYSLLPSPVNWAVKHQDAISNAVQVFFVAAAILGSILLLWRVQRRGGIPRWAWLWLGLYLLLMAGHIAVTIQNYMFLNNMPWRPDWLFEPHSTYALRIFTGAYDSFYSPASFLVLILLGSLLAKRHGRLAALLPLGYLLPGVIYGRISNDWPAMGTAEFTLMLNVAVAALLYRFIVALGGPLWIVRSATGKTRTFAGGVSLLALVGIQILFNAWMIDSYTWSFLSVVGVFSAFDQQFLQAAGVLLALALYREVPTKPMEIIAETQVAYE